MELINDKRLTPSMRRTRSGRNQEFTNPDTKEVIVLTHDKRSMYADLINGAWYWVEGCPECKGELRSGMTYQECDEHDRCSRCNTNRKDIVGAAWGGVKNGWTCNTCKQKEFAERRAEAFEKFKEAEYGEYDFYNADDIKCPHCGSKIHDDSITDTEELECGVCEGKVRVEVEISRSYTTSIVGKRVTE